MSDILYPDIRICYLCGLEILNGEFANEDHVISKLFFENEPPKQKGRDYYGKLLVHKKCNEFWGAGKSKMEESCIKSLKLINMIYSAERGTYNGKNVMLIQENSTSFLSKSDREFFGLIDLIKKDYNEISTGKVFNENIPINPFEKPINIALSVLAKNASAILIKSSFIYERSFWRILAVPIQDPNQSIPTELNLKKIGKELKYTMQTQKYGNYVSAFSYRNTSVVFGFTDLKDLSIANDFNILFNKNNFPVYFFEGNKLNDLLVHNWIKNVFSFK